MSGCQEGRGPPGTTETATFSVATALEVSRDVLRAKPLRGGNWSVSLRYEQEHMDSTLSFRVRAFQTAGGGSFRQGVFFLHEKHETL